MARFGKNSLIALSKAHPSLQILLKEAIKIVDFRILDSTRGRDAQELAFRKGNSKAHFGDSAHNYVPAIAVDLFPAPYNWNNNRSFINLYHTIKPIADNLNIPIRCGIDWNMNGVGKNDTDDWDGGHYELHPWRTWAKKRGVHLYRG